MTYNQVNMNLSCPMFTDHILVSFKPHHNCGCHSTIAQNASFHDGLHRIKEWKSLYFDRHTLLCLKIWILKCQKQWGVFLLLVLICLFLRIETFCKTCFSAELSRCKEPYFQDLLAFNAETFSLSSHSSTLLVEHPYGKTCTWAGLNKTPIGWKTQGYVVAPHSAKLWEIWERYRCADSQV